MSAHLMTVNEVAERIRVNPRTVRRWIDDGKLQAARVGGSIRVSQSEVEKFIKPGMARGQRPDMNAIIEKVEKMLAARPAEQGYNTADILEEVRKGREDVLLNRH